MNDFIIDGDKFSVSQNYLDIDSFEILSSPSPSPYSFKWDEAPSPNTLILNYLNENPNNVLLIDKIVYELYFITSNINPNQLYILDTTEENKTVYQALELISFLEDHSFTKGETLLVVGGGIAQDIGAFVGAAYKRGIPWIYFPTTLLSMCDSCIGGKTGLNHNKAKNQVALFLAPTKVIVNPHFLGTLEVDEFKKNHRKSLNYGHTFGHATEILTNYKIPHGQAVALGIIIVNKISLNKRLLSQEMYERIKNSAIKLIKVDEICHLDTTHLLDTVRKDKKVRGSSISLVLIKELGNIIFVKTEIEENLLQEINTILAEEF